MNATIRPEQIDETPEVDNDLAAVSEVEAGIREFVRNDIAYLRRRRIRPRKPRRSTPTRKPPSTTSIR